MKDNIVKPLLSNINNNFSKANIIVKILIIPCRIVKFNGIFLR